MVIVTTSNSPDDKEKKPRKSGSGRKPKSYYAQGQTTTTGQQQQSKTPTTLFRPAKLVPFSSPDLQIRIKEMELEELRIKEQLEANQNTPLAPAPRTVYFSGCDHNTLSHVNILKLDTWYWCNECILFRRISEISY
jgi:hypothetical protein